MVGNDDARGLSERIFFVSDDNRLVLDNALLRFHGRDVSDAELDAWEGLYSALEDSSGSSSRAWTAVCVTLVTHPDFSAY